MVGPGKGGEWRDLIEWDFALCVSQRPQRCLSDNVENRAGALYTHIGQLASLSQSDPGFMPPPTNLANLSRRIIHPLLLTHLVKPIILFIHIPIRITSSTSLHFPHPQRIPSRSDQFHLPIILSFRCQARGRRSWFPCHSSSGERMSRLSEDGIIRSRASVMIRSGSIRTARVAFPSVTVVLV